MAKKGTNDRDKLIGRNLRKFRNQAELTQTDLADELGMSFQQVQKYEKGTNRISGARIVQISDFLRIRPDQLLGTDLDHLPAARDEVSQLGQTPMGMDLAYAFNRIADTRVRKLLTDLAEALASNYREVAKPTAPIRAARTAPAVGADT